ncbi:YcjF family protein [Membranihabitans marinus]|uniref:YcjF family protein n=1 Tax=Membranihabitans marinus TaxID=1227546 RepID=UPI001F355A10|nr:DUF697 domain-containing protein [Membranihabitans marinus]
MNTNSSRADQAISNHMLLAMGAGLIPLPLADFFTVGAIQLDLIRQLCKVYEVDFKEEEGKAIVSALTASLLAKVGARTAIKLIPGIGSVIGGLTMSVLSGASTYATGHAFKTHFEKGGTILDIDLNRLKKYYQSKFEKGKEEAIKYKKAQGEQEDGTKEYSSKEGEGDSDFFKVKSEEDEKYIELIRKMKDLGELKKEGLITEEEFVRLKAKFLNEF